VTSPMQFGPYLASSEPAAPPAEIMMLTETQRRERVDVLARVHGRITDTAGAGW
jgi:hypothetical protein